MRQLLDIYDLAKRYKVSIRTLRRWRRRDELSPPDVILGRNLYWNLKTIEHDEQRSRGPMSRQGFRNSH